MSKNLKSLNSGVLKCGASQFKANIPSIQGVTLSPATNDPVNFVFEITKGDADMFMAAVTAANIPHASESYVEDEKEMVRVWLVMPIEQDTFSHRGIYIQDFARCYCYCSGTLPESFMSGLFQEEDVEVYFVNSVSTTGAGNFIQIPGGKMVFMKDLTLSSVIDIWGACSVIINGNVSIKDGHGHINFGGVGTEVEVANILVLGNVEQVSDIDANAFVGNVTFLYYNGEWNTTTRAWIECELYFLNDKPVDPLPEG